MIRLRLEPWPGSALSTRVLVLPDDGPPVDISGLVAAIRWEHEAGELPRCQLDLLPVERDPDGPGRDVFKTFDGLVAEGDIVTVTVGRASARHPAPSAVRHWAGSVFGPLSPPRPVPWQGGR